MTGVDRLRAETVAAVCRSLRLLAETRMQAQMRAGDMQALRDTLPEGKAGTALATLVDRLAAVADEADRALRGVEGLDLGELAAAIDDATLAERGAA